MCNLEDVCAVRLAGFVCHQSPDLFIYIETSDSLWLLVLEKMILCYSDEELYC